ncbi:hypothetical protein ABPG74_007566 [Tetrahymena malaccensis]
MRFQSVQGVQVNTNVRFQTDFNYANAQYNQPQNFQQQNMQMMGFNQQAQYQQQYQQQQPLELAQQVQQNQNQQFQGNGMQNYQMQPQDMPTNQMGMQQQNNYDYNQMQNMQYQQNNEFQNQQNYNNQGYQNQQMANNNNNQNQQLNQQAYQNYSNQQTDQQQMQFQGQPNYNQGFQQNLQNNQVYKKGMIDMTNYQMPSFQKAQQIDPEITLEKFSLFEKTIKSDSKDGIILQNLCPRLVSQDLIFSMDKIHIYPFLIRNCKNLAQDQKNGISMLQCGRIICINCLVVYLIKKTSYNFVQKLLKETDLNQYQGQNSSLQDFNYFKIKCPNKDCLEEQGDCYLSLNQVLDMIKCRQTHQNK